MMEAFDVVRGLEEKIAEYTGARCVCLVNSCSMALLLAFAWYKKQGGTYVTMPARTYPSVPMSAHHAGLDILWHHNDWSGVYQMYPSFIWDCAKRFTSGMYKPSQVQCVSFHVKKNLKLGQGGAILHDDPAAQAWYKKMRFDGRTEGAPTVEDTFAEPGWHCYLSPDVAARGLWLMQSYPKDVPDQEQETYSDMSKWRWI